MNLVNYILAKSPELPASTPPGYDYIVGSNGIFIRSKRKELEALVPVTFCKIRGLVEIKPYIQFDLPCVPSAIVAEMLERSRQALDKERKLVEIVFHLCWGGQVWHLEVPEQVQSHCRCKPVDDSPGSSYDRALIEVHSHHNMGAFFSGTDDADETGFRLYGVIGLINCSSQVPELRLRVGVHSNFWEIPADWVFEMSDAIVDALLPKTKNE